MEYTVVGIARGVTLGVVMGGAYMLVFFAVGGSIFLSVQEPLKSAKKYSLKPGVL